MRAAIQRVEQAILLQGPILREVQAVLRRGSREIWRVDGIPQSPAITGLLQQLEQAISATGSSTAPPLATGQNSRVTDRLSTTEAAQMLGLTERQVRNLGDRLDGQKVGSTWTFDRFSVLTEADRRKDAA